MCKSITHPSAETLVTLSESYIVGYNLKNEVKTPMINLCRNEPLFIPCENSTTCISTGYIIQAGSPRRYINTNAAAMLYLRAISNLTCHLNPLMSDITLQIDGNVIYIHLETRCRPISSSRTWKLRG
jgi:hypothetical protein